MSPSGSVALIEIVVDSPATHCPTKETAGVVGVLLGAISHVKAVDAVADIFPALSSVYTATVFGPIDENV